MRSRPCPSSAVDSPSKTAAEAIGDRVWERADIVLTAWRVRSIYVPSRRRKNRMPRFVEAVPPPAASRRSIGPRAAARLAEPGGERPAVGVRSRGVATAGAAARAGLTAKRARPQKAPQRLEKVEPAPGNGRSPAGADPRYLAAKRVCRRPVREGARDPFSPIAGRETGVLRRPWREKAPGDSRPDEGLATPRGAASRPQKAPQPLEKIDSAPGNGRGDGRD